MSNESIGSSGVTGDMYSKVKERKRWQIALRRYVINNVPNETYAPYFGLESKMFRQWIELQFTHELNWASFGKAWQFDHIVPVVYFDFSSEDDLALCWNFINIRVEQICLNKNRGNRVDVMAVRPYFQDLYSKTNYSFCLKMLAKISEIEVLGVKGYRATEDFIIENKAHLEAISILSRDEFNRLNQGVSLKDILFERELLRKFG